MKSSQRLHYATLSEVLGQRGLVEPQRLSLALQTSAQGGVPFPEMLVSDNMIGDWELSKTVCDLYGLPFLPVDICTPTEAAREAVDPGILRKHRIVPLSRHGRLLVVAMPAMVQANVLASLAETCDVHVLPVVGTVQTNMRWLQENLPAEVAPALPASAGEWSNLFDEGDAAVLLDLQGDSEPPTGDEG